MAYLKRTQVKAIVIKAINTVADIAGDVEQATFTGFTAFQKHQFLNALKSKLNASPYYMNDGTTNHLAYYDVDLIPDIFDEWVNVKDCIDWVKTNQKVVYPM